MTLVKTKTYNPTIDPGTGDYVISKGDTVPDYSLQFPAYLRMKVERENWMYAPNREYGSSFNRIKKRGSNSTKILENIAGRALQPLVDDGRAREISVSAMPTGHYSCSLEVVILEADRTIKAFEFNPVG